MISHYCTVCNVKLRQFKKITDWHNRKMHKRCYEKIKSQEQLQYFVKMMIERENSVNALRSKLFFR